MRSVSRSTPSTYTLLGTTEPISKIRRTHLRIGDKNVSFSGDDQQVQVVAIKRCGIREMTFPDLINLMCKIYIIYV